MIIEVTICILSVIFLFCFVTDNLTKNLIEFYFDCKEKKGKDNYPDLIVILDHVIQLEIEFSLTISHSVKDINLISNFDTLLKDISHSITAKINDRMIKRFENVGLDRSFVLAYIAKKVEIELLDYMQKNNFSFKKNI